MEPRNYRMVVSTKQDFVTASAIADRQLHHWLSVLKPYDTSALDEGRNEIAEGVTLDHDTVSGRHGAYSRWRLREWKDRPVQGTWQSTLVVRSDPREDGHRTWIQVDIEHLPASSDVRPIRANTPGIAKLLLDTLDAQDGLADVGTVPKFIEPDDVEEVIEELCDLDRRLPIVVASIPYGQNPEAWTEMVVEPAFKHLTGLAVMYVLRPDAQQLFEDALDYHRVFGGGIRTYLSGVDPAWQPDAQRHPVMSRATLEANPKRAAAILAALPQRLALRLPLPGPLDNLPVQRTRPRPAAHGSGLEELRAKNATLTTMLDEAEQRENAFADVLRDLRQQLQIAEELEFDQAAENQDLYSKLKHAERQVRVLQIRLEKAGQYDLAHAPVEEPADCPATFAKLLDRMGEFRHLRFTGNRKITRELDAQCIGNWVEVAWDALHALNAYAPASAAGTAGGDFRYWCAHLPDDCQHPFPAGKVKMKESKTVGSREDWRRERTFPVPEAVDPSRKLFMEAHLRIGGGNMVAPRLYFHDDGPNTGLVYVGYLGPHPTNTKT